MSQLNAIIRLEGILRRFADNADKIPVTGNTVGECIEDLIRRFPSIEAWLFDQNGILKSLILLDGHTINSKELDHPVKDRSELRIQLIVAGG